MLADTPVNSENVAKVLRTLRRIPDDVILTMATRQFFMGDPDECVVGWAIRDMGLPQKSYDEHEAVTAFGGTYDEWRDVYIGVCYFMPRGWDRRPCFPEIELAFVQRVDEAVKNSRKTSRR
jgi:hypothetical protein